METLTSKTCKNGFYVGSKPLYIRVENVYDTGLPRVCRIVKGLCVDDFTVGGKGYTLYLTKKEALGKDFKKLDFDKHEDIERFIKAMQTIVVKAINGKVYAQYPMSR